MLRSRNGRDRGWAGSPRDLHSCQRPSPRLRPPEGCECVDELHPFRPHTALHRQEGTPRSSTRQRSLQPPCPPAKAERHLVDCERGAPPAVVAIIPAMHAWEMRLKTSIQLSRAGQQRFLAGPSRPPHRGAQGSRPGSSKAKQAQRRVEGAECLLRGRAPQHSQATGRHRRRGRPQALAHRMSRQMWPLE